MPREIVVEPSVIADIMRLCGIYQHSACFCDHMKRISKNREHECYYCLSERILKAIGSNENTREKS